MGNYTNFLTIFDENSIEKLIFTMYAMKWEILLNKLLLKIEYLEMISDFYSNISHFGGGGISPVSPDYITEIYIKS